MFTSNPFAELSLSLSPLAIQIYVAVMIFLVVAEIVGFEIGLSSGGQSICAANLGVI